MSSVRSFIDLDPCQFFSQSEVKRCLIRAIKTGGGGGLSQVATQDSSTVTWSGTGKPGDPLIATAVIPTNPSNIPIAATNSSGTIIDGSSNVITRPLTGFVAGANTAISASNTILQAFQFAQGQINARITLASVLTGFTVGSNTAITASNTILQAFGNTQGQINARAPLASPAFTGTPTAPTAAAATNTTQLATTAFVHSAMNAVGGFNQIIFNKEGNGLAGSSNFIFSDIDGELILNSPTANSISGPEVASGSVPILHINGGFSQSAVEGGAVWVNGGSPVVNGNNGGGVALFGGSVFTNAAGNGGEVSLTGGQGGTATGDGGSISIQGGSVQATASGAGGSVVFSGGEAYGTGNGGSIDFIAGKAHGSGQPGIITFSIGDTSVMATNSQGALEFGNSGYGTTGQVLTSQGANTPPIWANGASTLSNTATLAFPTTNPGDSSDLTITVTGAVLGDVVAVGVPHVSVVPDSAYTAWVSAADTVTVRFSNYDSASASPASGTFKVTIIR